MSVVILKEGMKCPICYTTLTTVVRQDLRSAAEKAKHPLTVEQLKILNCLCLHPGDLSIGGFF